MYKYFFELLVDLDFLAYCEIAISLFFFDSHCAASQIIAKSASAPLNLIGPL